MSSSDKYCEEKLNRANGLSFEIVAVGQDKKWGVIICL